MSSRLLWLLLLWAALAGCVNREREAALKRLHGPAAKERAEAARALGKMARPGDDEIWVELERATRDPAPLVRIACAEAMLSAPKPTGAVADERGAVADDAVAALLSDLDESVQTAAAVALGKRCGERPVAYLQGAFNRSGASARAAISESLIACGVTPAQLFKRAEEIRRLRAVDWLSSTSSA